MMANIDNLARELIREIRDQHKEQLGPWMEDQVEKIKRKDAKLIANIGGQFAFTLTPTTMGVILVVSCEQTGEKINLTDFGRW